MFLPRSIHVVKREQDKLRENLGGRLNSGERSVGQQEETSRPSEEVTSVGKGEYSEGCPPFVLSKDTSEERLTEGSTSDNGEDEPVLSYSKLQRYPVEGEPVCVVCGRYGAYIVDKTDQDVCSLECKAKHLRKLGLTLMPKPLHTTDVGGGGDGGVATKWSYREHPQVTAMTPVQVDSLRGKMGIRVEGSHIPNPITEFTQLNLPEKLMLNLQTAGYHTLTPVQKQVIPATLYQRDLLVCSATGTGKTLSFILPVILRLLQDERDVALKEGTHVCAAPMALILAPTRELAAQLEEKTKQLMKGLPHMRTALVVGGIPIANQLYRLKAGVEVVVATPARLIDILEHHPEDLDLEGVAQFVVDEVDCLLHMGFKAQVCAIEEVLSTKRQTLMFSATIPSWVKGLAVAMMKNPLHVTVGELGVPCESVKHMVLWVEEVVKKKKLLSFLKDSRHFHPPAVIFVSSKKGSLLLADTINKSCIATATAVGLHGDMLQRRRTQILTEFLEGKHSVMVATSVLARGVDLHNVRQVFVFDFPPSLLEFIHQVGRAGRMGSPGSAVTFINNTNKSSFLPLSELLSRIGSHVPSEVSSSPHTILQREERQRRKRERDTQVPSNKKRRSKM